MIKAFTLRLVLICLLLEFSSFAQTPFFKKFGREDGLNSSTIFDINQDKEGNMWFFGTNGACKYDGYEFYTYGSHNSPLNAGSIYGSNLDNEGNIWMHGRGGLINKWDGKNFSFFKLETNIGYEKYPRLLVNELYKDDDDSLWISFANSIKPMKVGIDGCTNFPQDDEPYSNSLIIKIEKEGSIYRCYKERTRGKTDTIFIDFEGKRFTLPLNKPQPTGRHGYRLIRTKKGVFFLSIRNKLIKFDESGILDHRVFTENIYNALVEDHEGNIWIGQNSGAWRFKDGKLSDENALKMLEGKTVTDFFVDHEGGLWLSSPPYGIYYAPNPSVLTIQAEDLVKNSSITAIKAQNDTLWFGFGTGEVFYLHNNVYQQIGDPKDQRIGFIKDLDFDAEGKLWIATKNGAFRLENNKFVQYFNRYCTLAADPNKGVWIGYGAGFIHLVDGKKVYDSKDLKFKVNTVQLFFGKDDSLWLSTQPVAGFIYKDSSIIAVETDLKVNSSQKNVNYRVRQADDGDILGLVVYLKERMFRNHREIKFDDIRKTLIGKHQCLDIIDWQDSLWIGTLGGITRLSGTEDGYSYKRAKDFGWAYGLLDLEVHQLEKSDSILWVLSSKGISKVMASSLKSNKSPPPIGINKMVINDRDTNLLTHYDLEYNQNLLQFHFSGISFKSKGNLLYRYKLSGVNKNWVETRETSIQYSTLPHGDYRFSVYAANNDGVWSSTPAEIKFTIHPPFWKTWWFIALMVLSAAGLVWLIFYLRFRNLKIRMRLTNESLEAQQKALRAQMTPHFMFNALNSIQLLISNNEKIFAIKNVAKFARLMRNILDHSEHTLIPLKKEVEALDLYLELESLRFSGKFTYSIQIEDKLNTEKWFVPPMIIQPFIENSIWHGIMKKEKQQGKVEIKLTSQDKRLCVSVKDDGIGRKKAEEIKDFRIGGSKSTGLRIIKERLNNLRRQHNWEIELNILDLHENQEATGTEVILYLPKLEL